jgi:hypothetical protein
MAGPIVIGHGDLASASPAALLAETNTRKASRSAVDWTSRESLQGGWQIGDLSRADSLKVQAYSRRERKKDA